MSKQQARQSIRKRRQQIEPGQKILAAEKVLLWLLQLPVYQQSQHIAIYLSNDNEIDPSPILQDIFNKNKCCYLPIIDPIKPRQLLFMPYYQDTPLQTNCYGILEPELITDKVRDPKQLDLVIAPLVAFDSQCHRIGMGGGYYDNTFRFLSSCQLERPSLIGIAYEFQRVESITQDHWDVQLDGVITEQQIWWKQ